MIKAMKKLGLIASVAAVFMLLSACNKPAEITEPETINTPHFEVDESTNAFARPSYTVTFISDDGKILFIDSVEEGHTATPPSLPEMSYGNVFSKWTSDFSSVTKDIVVQPECQSVAGKTNVFAMASAYGKPGECVIVPFELCGVVCLCGFDLIVEYDPEQLALESVFDEDGDIFYNEGMPGQVFLNFVSVKDVESDVGICKFKFRILSESGELPVSVKMTSVYAGNEDEAMYIPEYEIIPAKVFVYHQ